MRIVTRKQHLDFQAVQAVPLQGGRLVRSLNGLYKLLDLASISPAHAEIVDSLDILLRSAFPIRTLRRSLTLFPNITDFILVAPRLRSALALRDIHLPQLVFFRTDLPHDTLVDFLAINTTVSILDLVGVRTHDRAHQCPLESVNLDNVRTLSGPASCVALLAPQGLECITMNIDATTSSTSAILRTITPVLNVHTLILDVYDNDDDILNSIASAFPRVKYLKLTEKALYKNRVSRARRAYNDPYAWSRALKKLPELQKILLRTTTSVVRKLGSWNDERATVVAWASGGRARAGSLAAPKPHATLHHIGLWYGAGPLGGGCLSHWSKSPGAWERTFYKPDPDADQPFV